jgi:hypothetical protein
VAFLAVVMVLLPRGAPGGPAARAPSWDIPFRMVTATAVVITLTALAHTLGPRLSGLLAPFPVTGAVLSIFTHRLDGDQAVVRLIRGMGLASFTFAGFFLVLAELLERRGTACCSAVRPHGQLVPAWIAEVEAAAARERVGFSDDFPARLLDLRFDRFELDGVDYDERIRGPDRRVLRETTAEAAIFEARVVGSVVCEPPAEDLLIKFPGPAHVGRAELDVVDPLVLIALRHRAPPSAGAVQDNFLFDFPGTDR